MRLRTLNTPECWNREALEAYADEITSIENNQKKSAPNNFVFNEGQIGCHGCHNGVCTAELAISTTSPLSVAPFPTSPESARKVEDIDGFEIEQPKGWNEAEVIELKRDAA